MLAYKVRSKFNVLLIIMRYYKNISETLKENKNHSSRE